MSEDLCAVCRGLLRPWALGKLKCQKCGRTWKAKREAPQKDKLRSGARSYRKQSDKQEKRVAKQVGGRTTIASGQTPIDKGDVRSDAVRVECKYTDKKSFTLKVADLLKVAEQATGDQIPLFYIEYRESGEAYYVVPEDWFLQLLETYQNDPND